MQDEKFVEDRVAVARIKRNGAVVDAILFTYHFSPIIHAFRSPILGLIFIMFFSAISHAILNQKRRRKNVYVGFFFVFHLRLVVKILRCD